MKKILIPIFTLIFTLLFITQSSAAVTTYVSDEVGGNNQIARDSTDLLDDNWMTNANAIYQCNGNNSTDVTRINISNSFNADNLATVNGVTLGISLQNVTNSTMGTANGTNFSAQASTTTLQSNAPMPSSMTVSGYYANETGGSSASRNGALFKFSSPVRAFGAWFGDLEARTTNQFGSVRAYVRYFDQGMNQIGSDVEVINTINESQCGSINTSNEFVGCGNATTRWIGFVSDSTTPVSYMMVVVGDDDTTDPSNPYKVDNIDTTNGNTESISFVGPTLVTTGNCVPTSSSSSSSITNTSSLSETSLSSSITTSNNSSSSVDTSNQTSSISSSISSDTTTSSAATSTITCSTSNVTSSSTNTSLTTSNSSMSSSCNCSPSFDSNVCWNKVMTTSGGGQYFWGSSCKGEKLTCGQVCTQTLVPLTSSETMQYLSWQNAGMPTILGCEIPVCTTSTSSVTNTSANTSSSTLGINSSTATTSQTNSTLTSSMTSSVASTISHLSSTTSSTSSLIPTPSCGGVSNDLSVTKTHTGDFVKGQNTIFSIKVKNNGPYGATSPITITDVLPVGMLFVSSTDLQNSGFICGVNGQVVTCIRNSDMSVGEEVTLSITALVKTDAACGPMSNFVTVMCGCRDSNPNNNTAVDNGIILCVPSSSTSSSVTSTLTNTSNSSMKSSSSSQSTISTISSVTTTVLPTGNVCQKIFWDNNNNGMYDAGDMPIANVTINLNLSDGRVFPVITNQSGDYCVNVPFGNTVAVVDYNDTDIRGICAATINTTTNLVQTVNVITANTNYLGNVGFYKICTTSTMTTSNISSIMSTTSVSSNMTSSSSNTGQVLGTATSNSTSITTSMKSSTSSSTGSVLGLATTGADYAPLAAFGGIISSIAAGLMIYMKKQKQAV